MLFSTIGQGWVFLWMMVAGAAIGAWFGLLEGIRRLLQSGFWLNLVLDLLFGVGAAAIFVLGLVYANYGRIRLFAVVGAILGCVLFIAGLRPPLKAAVAWMERGICRLISRIKQHHWIKIIFR